ncbi:hypothetical protein IVB40_13455 [Bradyrhizobium sp. 40]|uniref:hypothetical protein n=1 Tax=Bradyrhizobium sp. 40 TaxID=2782674 RepID=UPI001FFEE4B6|nr:hypothetical protein [Bradyrhizobium sp. 40]UPJ44949.1 hypothetical protein IVB40_13455 [Bradyrhizobium sp. 40]
MAGPDDLLVGLNPSQPRKKIFSLRNCLLIATVPGLFLGFLGSLVESSRKEPFALMFHAWGVCTDSLPTLFSKSLDMLWFGITNFHLYSIVGGLLLFLLLSSFAALMVGIVAGTLLGGILYWLISIAQP